MSILLIYFECQVFLLSELAYSRPASFQGLAVGDLSVFMNLNTAATLKGKPKELYSNVHVGADRSRGFCV